MATISSNLRLTLIGTGEQAGTWGTTTNTNLGTLLEQAICGYTTQVISDVGDTTITIPDGASGTGRYMYIELTGALTGARDLIVPAYTKLYYIYNNTTGGYAVTVKVSGLTGVSVPNGAKTLLVCNGTDIVNAQSYLSTLTLGSALTVANGGTGATSITGLAKGNGTAAFTAAVAGTDYVAPGGALGTPSSGTLTNCTADGTNPVGFRNIPASANTTLAVGDVGKCITATGTITIPNSTFSAGDAVSIFNNSSGSITLSSSLTTTYLAGTSTTGSTRTLATRGLATVYFISPTVAVISGAGLS
jgi:hypothetical protein